MNIQIETIKPAGGGKMDVIRDIAAVRGIIQEVERLNVVLASIHAATDLKTARRRAFEGRTRKHGPPVEKAS
jgi:hypothetical protein